MVSTHKVYCTVKVVYTYGRLICHYRPVRYWLKVHYIITLRFNIICYCGQYT